MKILNFTSGWNLRGVAPGRYSVMTVILMVLANSQMIHAQQQELPDMELLEFLGEGVQVENEIVDPLDYRDIEKVTGSDQEQTDGQQDND